MTVPIDERVADESAVQVGLIASLTGAASSLGQTELQAAQLSLSLRNASGGVLGRALHLATADDQSNADRAGIEAERLASDGVVAMIGPSIAATSLAVIPVVNEHRLPTILMTPFDYPGLGREPFIFSPIAVSLAQGLVPMFRHLRSQGVEKLGIVAGTDPVGDRVEAVADELGASLAIDTTTVRVVPGSTNCADALLRLRDEGVGAVFAGMTGSPSASVRRNQIELSWDVPFYSHAGNVGPAFVEPLGVGAEGVAWWSTATPVAEDLPDGPQKRLVGDVLSAYRSEHGEPSNYLAVGLGFDSVHSVANAIEAAGSDDPVAIRDALEVQDILGVNGRARRSPTDHRGSHESDAYVVGFKESRYHLLQG